jgi:hypothetical protein
MSQKNSEILGDEWITPSLVESEYPGLILPEYSIVSEGSIVSEDFLASGDSLVSEDFIASENNFTSEYSLAPQEIDVDPLTGISKNPTVNADNDDAEFPVRNLTVRSIRCIKAGADRPGWWSDDDIYIKVGYEKIWGINSMDDGDTRRVSRSVEYIRSTTISVWDDDPVGPDDLIGTIRVNGFYRGPAKLVTGSGSQYSVNFTST